MHRIALLAVIVCSCLAGCAFDPKVEIRNATGWPLDVELALPRAPQGSDAGPTQFRATIPPGGSWTNVDAPPEDRADLRLRKTSDSTLLRVKAEGSQTQGFVAYRLDYALRAIATVRQDKGGAFDVVVQINERGIFPARKAEEEHFE